MKRFVLLLLLAAAVAFAIWFGMHGKVRTASSNAALVAMLPKETLALVHIPDISSSLDAWKKSDLYRLWSEPALQDFLQKPLSNAGWTSSDAEKLHRQFQKLGMRDTFVALTGIANDRPEIAAGFRFNGRPEDARKVISKWRAAFEGRSPGFTATVLEYKGHQVELMTRDTAAVATAYIHNWFLAANSVELLEKFLDRLDADSKAASATLGGDERYAAAFKHMPNGYALFAYARLDLYFDHLANRSQDAGTNPQFATLRQIQSVAAATTITEGKMHDVLFVGMPKQGDESEPARSSLALTTKDSFLYSTSLMRLPIGMPLPDTAPVGAAGWLDQFQQKMAALGSTGFTREEFNSAFGSEVSLIGDWPENTQIPALLATVPVRDVEQANRIVAAATAVADEDRPWTHDSKDGVEYYTLPPANPLLPVSPTIAVTGQSLIAGLNPGAVEAAIARWKANEPNLSGTTRFKTAESLVPKPAQSFTYLDTDLLYTRLDATLRPMLVMAAAFLPGIANKVDLSKLPPAEVVTAHLSPMAISQRYQTDGYLTESVGPISILQAAIGTGGASAIESDFYLNRSGSVRPASSGTATTSGRPNLAAPSVSPSIPDAEESPEDFPQR